MFFLILWIYPSVQCLRQSPSHLFNKNITERETVLSTEDFQRAKYVFDKVENHEAAAALEKAGLFEGDIHLANHSLEAYTGPNPEKLAQLGSKVLFNAVASKYETWLSRDIPYTISTQYSAYSRSRIAAAMDEYARRTCVRFVPRTSEEDYIFITPDNGCYSMVGRLGGRQLISLDAGCIATGIIIHELMHSVGFFHEQSRADRDEFVNISWENIMYGMEGQFKKFSLNEIQHLAAPYDYGSIMHYATTAFSRNGLPTISPKDRAAEIGQRRGFSEIDISKINKLYDCSNAGLFTAPLPVSTTTTRATTVTTQPLTNLCKDHRSDCAYLKSLHYCEPYRDWMNRYCGKTCSFCDASKPAVIVATLCQDHNEFCKLWAGAKYCDNPIFSKYLQSNCRSSCKLC